MSLFSNGSFKKEYIEYDNRYLDQIVIHTPSGTDTYENIRFLLNSPKGGFPFVEEGNAVFISDRLKLDLKVSDIEGFFLHLKEPHYLLLYFEVFDDIRECFSINKESQCLLRLFYKYGDKISKDNLHSLRKELLSYRNLTRKDIRNMPHEDFILCIEKVFNIRKMCLTTPHALSDLSIDQQREGIIHGILYTLSVLHGEPDSFFYNNIPSEWTRSNTTFNSLVWQFVRYMCKIKFLTTYPHEMGDMIHEYIQSLDSMWVRYYVQHNSVIKKSKEASRGCKIKNSGTRLKYAQNGRYTLSFGEDEKETIDISKIEDIENLATTVPEYLPVVLGGTEDIVSLMNMNSCYKVKMGETMVCLLGLDPINSMFVMKTVVQAQSVFDILEVVTEYIFSRMIHAEHRFKSIQKSIPIVYTIRDDVKYSDDMFSIAKRTFPTTIIMERKDGNTLHAIMMGMDRQAIITVLRNVFQVLDLLYREIEFTHYDLHPGNIIVDPDTLDIALIDMARCRFKTEDGWLGRYFSYDTMKFTGVHMDRPYPAIDIFRLLMSCWGAGHRFLDTIINFLFSLEPSVVSKMYSPSLYSLPYLDKYKDMTYDDVLQLLVKA